MSHFSPQELPMSYGTYILLKVAKVVAAIIGTIILLPMILLYFLAWGGILVGLGAMGQEAYVMPLAVQAVLWFSVLIIWSSYCTFKTREGDTPTQTMRQFVGGSFLIVTLVGFYLAEGYHGLYSESAADLAKVFSSIF